MGKFACFAIGVITGVALCVNADIKKERRRIAAEAVSDNKETAVPEVAVTETATTETTVEA